MGETAAEHAEAQQYAPEFHQRAMGAKGKGSRARRPNGKVKELEGLYEQADCLYQLQP